MFAEFELPQGNILLERVNSIVGCLFLGTCALWAAVFVWNVTTGSNPIDHAIISYVEQQAFADSR
jgi:hypothetical protein